MLIHNDPGDGKGPYVEIPLTRGKVARVSPEDASIVAGLRWSATPVRHTFYAQRTDTSMHRMLAGAQKGEQVDHVNGDGLDNRRLNIRRCTLQQNHFNRRKMPGTTSRYRGVSFDQKYGKWRVGISINGKNKNLGRYASEVEAARAYDRAASKLHGEFFRPNLPQELP